MLELNDFNNKAEILSAIAIYIDTMKLDWDNCDDSSLLRSFDYDDMNRLSDVNEFGGWFQSYFYDLNANMTKINDNGT